MRRLALIAVCACMFLGGCAGDIATTDTEGRSRLAPVAEAQRWVGKDAHQNRTELKKLMAAGNQGQPVDPAVTPWCAGFMNAMLTKTGWGSTNSLAARSFLNYGARTKDPNEGDIVVLRRGHSNWTGHVGFFMGYEYYDGTTYVKVLGGNTNRSVDMGYFPVNRILGFRRLNS